MLIYIFVSIFYVVCSVSYYYSQRTDEYICGRLVTVKIRFLPFVISLPRLDGFLNYLSVVLTPSMTFYRA